MISPTLLPRPRPAAVRGLRPWGLALVLLLAACASPSVQKAPSEAQPEPPPAATPEPEAAVEPETPLFPQEPIRRIEVGGAVKVGLLLPLSGRHARLGETLSNAAQLAVFDVADDRFTLLVKDTGGTPLGAQQAARDAIAEGARLLIGPVFANSVSGAAGEARPYGINVISFSNDRSVAGDGVFVLGLAPETQVERIVGFSRAQGLERIAVLAPRTPYGESVVAAARAATIRYGSQLARIGFYDPEAADVSAEVRQFADYDERHRALLAQRQALAARDDEAAKRALKRLDGLDTLGPPEFDAVLVPESGKRILTVAPMLAYFDVDPAEVRFLGTSAWEDPGLLREPTLQGGWFPVPQRELWLNFAARYRDTFDATPTRIAGLAYDATALAAVLAQRALAAGREPRFGADELTQTSGFAGINGLFRLRPDGTNERSLAVMTIENGGFATVDPAPQSFQQLGY